MYLIIIYIDLFEKLWIFFYFFKEFFFILLIVYFFLFKFWIFLIWKKNFENFFGVNILN